MTPKERAAMQQALEALENERSHMTANWDNIVKAITALREALAEQAKQNTAINDRAKVIQEGFRQFWKFHGIDIEYAAPVRTKDLTDDEINHIYLYGGRDSLGAINFARAVIAADREKNK